MCCAPASNGEPRSSASYALTAVYCHSTLLATPHILSAQPEAAQNRAGPTLGLCVPEPAPPQPPSDTNLPGESVPRPGGGCVLVKDPVGATIAAVFTDGSIVPVAAFATAAALLVYPAAPAWHPSAADRPFTTPAPPGANDSPAGSLAEVQACLLPCGLVTPLDDCQRRHVAAAAAGTAYGGRAPGPAVAADTPPQPTCARVIHHHGSPIAAAVLDSGAADLHRRCPTVHCPMVHCHSATPVTVSRAMHGEVDGDSHCRMGLCTDLCKHSCAASAAQGTSSDVLSLSACRLPKHVRCCSPESHAGSVHADGGAASGPAPGPMEPWPPGPSLAPGLPLRRCQITSFVSAHNRMPSVIHRHPLHVGSSSIPTAVHQAHPTSSPRTTLQQHALDIRADRRDVMWHACGAGFRVSVEHGMDAHTARLVVDGSGTPCMAVLGNGAFLPLPAGWGRTTGCALTRLPCSPPSCAH